MLFFALGQKLNLDLILLSGILIFENFGHFMANFRQKWHFVPKMAIKWPNFSKNKMRFSKISSKLSF